MPIHEVAMLLRTAWTVQSGLCTQPGQSGETVVIVLECNGLFGSGWSVANVE